MEKNIEIEIICSDSEIRKAISFYILRIRDMRTYAFIIYTTLFAVIILSLIFSNYALPVLVYLLCGFVLYYLYYQRPIKGYLKAYEKRKNRTYRFENDKIVMIGVGFQTECAWSMFKKAYEIPSAFLLMDENSFIYILPKSSFCQISVIEELSNFLVIKILGFKIYR